MEPIFFRPTYKNVIWGGTNIAKIFKRKVEGDDIGESWELSAHPNGLSQIENESFGNISLLELFNDKSRRKEIFGTNCENFLYLQNLLMQMINYLYRFIQMMSMQEKMKTIQEKMKYGT